MTKNKTPYMIIILDGWGINPQQEGNAISLAGTPVLSELKNAYPNTHLACSGPAVGLPEGIMGNSEVGHLNIGAGRTVYQDLLRIDMAIENGSFFENEALNQVMSAVKNNGCALHLMGLLSDGGVHSQIDHLFSILKMADSKGVRQVFIHPILDGRDTAPDSGIKFIARLQDYIRKADIGSIATICGRFYAMDRDTRWERVEKAYQLYTAGEGISETDPVQAVANAYHRGESDEFVKPIVIMKSDGKPIAAIRDGDGMIFFNFRADRAREITRAFTDTDFDEFEREYRPQLCAYICMTLYDEHFKLPVAFPPVHLESVLGDVISRKGLTQLRIAETEKYAHVTYFFNGGEENPFPMEERSLIPSPRNVATYDLMPEMSAYPLADEVVSRIRSGRYDLIVLNFANMDMVGHTGILNAAIRACQAVDECVGKVMVELQKAGGVALITADHGNSEKMIDENGNPYTAHTTNNVPLILVDNSRKNVVLRPGILGDIAPTLLDIMGIDKPADMTGRTLIE